MKKILLYTDALAVLFIVFFMTDIQPLLLFEWFRKIHPFTWMGPRLLLLLYLATIFYVLVRVAVFNPRKNTNPYAIH